MKTGYQARFDRLFNRHGDGVAVCVAADHGYMSDVTENVINLRPITVLQAAEPAAPTRSGTDPTVARGETS